ncbi:hypothetical protein RhiLY_13490 [Ceratobasidium sp. AG-Ba]|nr:hypothetical protein RhiLY_13490 [Ceratobasidium sp. AG-Ba]
MPRQTGRQSPAQSGSSNCSHEPLFQAPNLNAPTLSAAQRIVLVDQFGSEEIQALQKYADELFALALQHALRLKAKNNTTKRPRGVSDNRTEPPLKNRNPSRSQRYRTRNNQTSRPESVILPFLCSILLPLPMQHPERLDLSRASGFPVSQTRTPSNEHGSLGFAANHNMQWDATPPSTAKPTQFYPSAEGFVGALRVSGPPSHHNPNPSAGTTDDFFSGLLSSGQSNTFNAPDLDYLVHRQSALQLASSALEKDPRIGGPLVLD